MGVGAELGGFRFQLKLVCRFVGVHMKAGKCKDVRAGLRGVCICHTM